MTEPQVQVFGPLQVSLDGRAARIGARRQRAVLGRLVVAGGKTLGIDKLVDDVWEGAPPPNAPAVLQVQIHNLRRVLEPTRRPRTPARILVSEGSGYALRLDSGNVDAWRFEAVLRRYEQRVHDPRDRPDPAERYRILDEALNCWHGAAFESFADASWAAAEVARLTDLRATAIEMRAHAALELDRVGEVVAVLRRQVEEFPGREESARLLAVAQYRLGQQVEALATVRRTREYLRTEYGIDPGPRLDELESAILNHGVAELMPPTEPAGLPVVARAAPADSAGRPERPGRHWDSTFYPSQRAALLAAAAEARSAGLRLAWVVGEVGTGKTTLVSGLREQLAAQGWATAYACVPEVDGAPPAWAWTEILAGLGGEPMRADPFTLARAVAQRCREAVRDNAVAIVVEDLHRADAATLQVLRQLVNWLDREPVLIAVTARGPELPALLRATEAALADRVTERVELHGVDVEGTRRIAQGAGLVAIEPEMLRTLHRRTGGNPLFVRELTKLMVTQGDSVALPETIRSVLTERIEQLPEGVLTLLQYVAIWGRPLDPELLAELSGVGEEELVDRVDAAAVAGLIVLDDRGRIALAHALVQDTVYDRISPLRRSRMHWGALELLERRGAEPAVEGLDAGLRGLHAARGATRATAAHALTHVIVAAHRSDQRGQRADAAMLWQAAARLHESAGHARQSAARSDRLALVRALCALTDALAYDGQFAAARAARRRAFDLAVDLGDEALFPVLTCWRTPVIWGMRPCGGSDRRLREAMESALARANSPVTRARLLIASVYEAGVEEIADPRTHERACHAVDVARRCDDPDLICAALVAVAYVITGPAARDGWQPLADELLRAARTARLTHYEAVGHYLRFRAACRTGDLRAAARHWNRALDRASASRLRPVVDILSAFPAVVALLRGAADEAKDKYRQFDSRLRKSTAASDSEIVLFGDLTVAWAQGDLSGLVDRLGALYAVRPDPVAQVYALALLHAGEPERARIVFAEHPNPRPDFYRIISAAFRARTAVAVRDHAVAAELLDALRPCSGTLIGLDTGAVVFGVMDELLAELAEMGGDAAAAAEFRRRAVTTAARVSRDLAALP
ncbi:BTAD domain-containing putative transcriptional regulator [Nocardia sp. NPDC003482]